MDRPEERNAKFVSFWFVHFVRPSQQEKYENLAGDDPPPPQKDEDGSVQIIEDAPLTMPKTTVDQAAPQVSRTGPNGMIIRGMTFYKSEPDPMVADDGDPGENCRWSEATSREGQSTN